MAESTRIRHLKDCIVEASILHTGSYETEDCRCPAAKQATTVPDVSAPDSLSHTLYRAIAAPVTFAQPNALVGAQAVFAPPIPPFVGATEPPQGPGVAFVSRQFTRIRGIDAISKPVTGASKAGSTRTSAIRSAIQAQTNANRYPLTVLPEVPYPQTLPRPSGPQPGVPIAPSPSCNLTVARF